MDILLKKGFTWKNVYEVFQTDLKLFIFIIMLLFVFRLSFIVTMGDYFMIFAISFLLNIQSDRCVNRFKNPDG